MNSKPRRIVLHADDLGMSQAVSDGIFRGFREGLLTSTSLLANGSDALRAIVLWKTLAAEYDSGEIPSAAVRARLDDPQQAFDFGVHLNLTEGRPLIGSHYPSELLDADGRFPGIVGLFLRLWRHGDRFQPAIQAEFERQVQLVRDHGLQPTHVNGHQYVEMLPWVAGVAIELVDRYEIGTIRVAWEPGLWRLTVLNGQLWKWPLARVMLRVRRAIWRASSALALPPPTHFSARPMPVASTCNSCGAFWLPPGDRSLSRLPCIRAKHRQISTTHWPPGARWNLRCWWPIVEWRARRTPRRTAPPNPAARWPGIWNPPVGDWGAWRDSDHRAGATSPTRTALPCLEGFRSSGPADRWTGSTGRRDNTGLWPADRTLNEDCSCTPRTGRWACREEELRRPTSRPAVGSRAAATTVRTIGGRTQRLRSSWRRTAAIQHGVPRPTHWKAFSPKVAGRGAVVWISVASMGRGHLATPTASSSSEAGSKWFVTGQISRPTPSPAAGRETAALKRCASLFRWPRGVTRSSTASGPLSSGGRRRDRENPSRCDDSPHRARPHGSPAVRMDLARGARQRVGGDSRRSGGMRAARLRTPVTKCPRVDCRATLSGFIDLLRVLVRRGTGRRACGTLRRQDTLNRTAERR